MDEAWELSETSRFIFPCTASPEHAGLFIGGDIDGFEGDTVCSENGLETGGGRYDMRGAGGEGRVDVESWVR